MVARHQLESRARHAPVSRRRWVALGVLALASVGALGLSPVDPATAASSAASVSVPESWSAVVQVDSGANADMPAPALPGQYVNRAAMEERLVGLANEARAAKGLAALVVDPRLTRLSRWWAASTGLPVYAGRGTSHCPANLCSKRAAEIGYPSFGEVIRPRNPFPVGDMAAERFFVNSPRHMAILTNPKVTHIGYGVHIVGDAANPQSLVVVGQVGRAR